MLKLTYKGRSFSSSRALADALKRDLESSVERKIRSAASASGLSTKKTSKGIEVSGEADKMDRFYKRLSR